MFSPRFPIIDSASTTTTPLVAFKRGKDNFSYQAIQKKDHDEGAGLAIYRAPEINQVRQLITEKAFVVLIGPPGCGKSHILRTIEKEHTDVFFFDGITCLPIRYNDWYVDETRNKFHEALLLRSKKLVLIDEVADDPTSVAVIRHATNNSQHVLAAFGGPAPNKLKIDIIQKTYATLNPAFVEMSLKPLTKVQIRELVQQMYNKRYPNRQPYQYDLNLLEKLTSHLIEVSDHFPVDSSLIRGANIFSDSNFTSFKNKIAIRRMGIFHYNEGCCIALPEAIRNNHQPQY